MVLNNLIQPETTVLDGHHESVNALRFNPDLSLLLSGDNSGYLIIWDLALHEPFQKIDASYVGSVTAVCWITVPKNSTSAKEDPAPAFAVGFGTGIIAIYKQCSENRRFEISKNIEAHDGPIEDLTFDKYYWRLASTGGGYPQVWNLGSANILQAVSPSPIGFHTYMCKGVHFADRGETLIVTYIESHTIMKYSIDPWALKLSQVVQTRIGFSFLDGDSLFISNLCNGVDLYSVCTMQRLRHYDCPVTINLPLQVALARQGLDQVVMGGVDGITRVYDRDMGTLVHRLEHKAGGRVQVVDALSTHDTELIAAASSTLGQKSTIQLWLLKGSSNIRQSNLPLTQPSKSHYLGWES